MYTNMARVMTDDMVWKEHNWQSLSQNEIIKTKILMNICDQWNRYQGG